MAPVTAQVMMTLSRGAAMKSLLSVNSVGFSRPALVCDELHQTPVAPRCALCEIARRQRLTSLPLDSAHQRLVPRPRLLRPRDLVIGRSIAGAIVSDAARRVEIDRLEGAHERPA